MLQSAVPLRTSAPGPPNISDEHVSCTAPARRNASCQILCKCPTPAIVFGNGEMTQNPHVLLTFGNPQNPLRLPRRTTTSERQKMVRFLVFSLANVLRATTACTFFDISTSKSAPKLRCFVRFDLQMCFAPQRRATFFDISTSKSAPKLRCFVRFDLQTCFAPQLRATFHLSSGQVAPHPPLERAYFSTLRSHKSLEKHNVSRLSYLFAHLHLLSSDSFSSLIFSLLLFSSLTLPTSAFPSVHIVGSLTSKLPSIIVI